MKHLISDLLHLKCSFSMIVKELKKDNIFVSKGTISKIKNLKVFSENKSYKVEKKVNKREPKFNLKSTQLKKLLKDVSEVNQKSKNQLGTKLNVHRTIIFRYIKKNLV